MRIARLPVLNDFDTFINSIHYRQLIAQLELHVVKVAVKIGQLLLDFGLLRFNSGRPLRFLLLLL